MPTDPPVDDTRPSPTRAGRPGGRSRRLLGAVGSTRRVLLRNAGWSGASFVLTAVVTFFLSPYLIRTLGKDGYGIWDILIALTGYLNLADFGVRPAIVHFVARHTALDERDTVNRYVSSAFVTFAAGGALAIVVGAAILPWFGGWFHAPAPLRPEATWAAAISILSLALSLPLNAFSGFLIGTQRFDVSARVDLATVLLRTAGTVGVLAWGYGLVGLATVNFVCSLGNVGAKSWFAFRLAPWLRFSPSLVGRTQCRRLLTFGALNLVVVGAHQLIFRTDALVIGASLGAAWVTYYAMGARLPGEVKGMVEVVGRVLTPALGAMDARGERESVATLITRSSRVLLLLAGPVIVYLAVFGPAFLERWLRDPSFRHLSGPVILVTAVSIAAYVASFPLRAMHQGTNRMRSLAIFALGEGVANLGLSLALVRPMGILGVALGTAVPALVVRGLLMPWWTCRQFEMSLGEHLARVWILPILAALLTFGSLRVGFDPTRSYGWPALLGLAALTAGTYWVVALAMGGLWARVRVWRPAGRQDRGA